MNKKYVVAFAIMVFLSVFLTIGMNTYPVDTSIFMFLVLSGYVLGDYLDK